MSTDYTPSTFASNPTPTQLNAEFESIRVALDAALSRLGGTPNQLEADLDLNGNDILNAGNLPDEANLTQLQTDVTDLQTRLTAAEAAITQLDSDLAGNISSLQSDLNQVNFLLDQRLGVLEAVVDYEERSVSFEGVLPDNTRVASVVVSRDCVIRAADTHPARNVGAPTGAASFQLKRDGTDIGTVDYASGQLSGIGTFAQDEVFTEGATLEIHTLTMNGMVDPYFTIKMEIT